MELHHRSRLPVAALLLVPCLISATALAQRAEDDDAEARALLEPVDELYRGETSRGTVTMKVHTDRYDRTLRMEVLSKGEDKALIRVLSPQKEKGVTTLRVGDDIYNYLPKVDRTIKLPVAMMSGAWMGSHFTNDDLVQVSRMAEDYDARIVTRPDDNKANEYVVELKPEPDAPVVWGRVVVHLSGKDRLPTRVEYYDERGELARTLSYSNVRNLAGRRRPTTVRVEPADRPGEYTEFTQETLELDANVPDEEFDVESLKG